MCPTASTHRKVAAISFMHLLRLEKHGLVITTQDQIYQDIAINLSQRGDVEVRRGVSQLYGNPYRDHKPYAVFDFSRGLLT